MRITNKSGIPLYAAEFADPTTIVVAGGGGQGAHGVQNKVLVYKLTERDVAVVSELVLPQGSDSPTSMAIAEDSTIWLGANIPDEKTGKIHHLLRLKLDEDQQLVKDDEFDLFHNTDISIYQKSTSVAGTMVSAASSAADGQVAIMSATSGDVVRMHFDHELVDVAMSDYNEQEQRFVAAAMEREIEIRVISKPNVKYIPSIPAPKGGKWSRIVAVKPGKFVAAATLGSREGAQLSVIEVKDFGEAKVSHTVPIPAFKGITALATNGFRVAVASPTGDIYVYNVRYSEPTVVTKMRYVHKLPVTAVALSEDGETVVSTSMDGSLAVNCEIGNVVSLKATLGWALLSAFIIMLIALALTIVSFPVPEMDGIAPPNLRDIRRSLQELMAANSADDASEIKRDTDATEEQMIEYLGFQSISGNIELTTIPEETHSTVYPVATDTSQVIDSAKSTEVPVPTQTPDEIIPTAQAQFNEPEPVHFFAAGDENPDGSEQPAEPIHFFFASEEQIVHGSEQPEPVHFVPANDPIFGESEQQAAEPAHERVINEL